MLDLKGIKQLIIFVRLLLPLIEKINCQIKDFNNQNYINFEALINLLELYYHYEEMVKLNF